MILVSFSSAEDALSNDVKKYTTFKMQGTENPPFRFFGTPGIGWHRKNATILIIKFKDIVNKTDLLFYFTG